MATPLLSCARRPPLGRAWRPLSNRALRPLSSNAWWPLSSNAWWPLSSRAWWPPFSRAWKPVVFPNEPFTPIPADEEIEEETLPKYIASEYYPVRLGEIFRDRYQIVGKLGYGTTSTVWLARDLCGRQHVALKLYIHSNSQRDWLDNELEIYKRIENASEDHPGRSSIRPLLDSFDVDGPNGRHQCLVHPPLWDSVRQLRRRNDVGRLPVPVVAVVLLRVFRALDFLHNECNVIHTDIKEDNVFFGGDEVVLKEFEQAQLAQPTPRKEVDGGIVYLSRKFALCKSPGAPVLCDFGSALPMVEGAEHPGVIQPHVYRSPEVILDAPWTHKVDIWNVGCMVWNMFEGGTLFDGTDPEHGEYRERAHLAEMIALLGPPPSGLLARADLRSEFFSDAGDWCAGIPIPESRPLELRETTFLEEDDDIRELTMVGDKEDRECFLRFMRKMLQWDPEKRSTARELLEDEWMVKHTSS